MCCTVKLWHCYHTIVFHQKIMSPTTFGHQPLHTCTSTQARNHTTRTHQTTSHTCSHICSHEAPTYATPLKGSLAATPGAALWIMTIQEAGNATKYSPKKAILFLNCHNLSLQLYSSIPEHCQSCLCTMNATAMKTQIVKPAVAVRAARPARQAVVVRAAAEESRRAVLTGFVAGMLQIDRGAHVGWGALPVYFVRCRLQIATRWAALVHMRLLTL